MKEQVPFDYQEVSLGGGLTVEELRTEMSALNHRLHSVDKAVQSTTSISLSNAIRQTADQYGALAKLFQDYLKQCGLRLSRTKDRQVRVSLNMRILVRSCLHALDKELDAITI